MKPKVIKMREEEYARISYLVYGSTATLGSSLLGARMSTSSSIDVIPNSSNPATTILNKFQFRRTTGLVFRGKGDRKCSGIETR